MGFTRSHLVGVFVTETMLAIIGMGFGSAVLIVFSQDWHLALALLIASACIFLLQISVLLSSILSLLFYSRSERDIENA